MLPDFPNAKAHARRALIQAISLQVSRHEPILGEIRRTRVHEGKGTHLQRADASTDDIHFATGSAELMMPREQMRSITARQLFEHAVHISKQLAGQQAKMMFERISEAVEEVGNSVSRAELGDMEAFLEMERRIEMDFDPETLEPKNLVFVVHPSQIDELRLKAEEWEKNPEFRARRAEIRKEKLEAWRARENRRKLVD